MFPLAPGKFIFSCTGIFAWKSNVRLILFCERSTDNRERSTDKILCLLAIALSTLVVN